MITQNVVSITLSGSGNEAQGGQTPVTGPKPRSLCVEEMARFFEELFLIVAVYRHCGKSLQELTSVTCSWLMWPFDTNGMTDLVQKLLFGLRVFPPFCIELCFGLRYDPRRFSLGSRTGLPAASMLRKGCTRIVGVAAVSGFLMVNVQTKCRESVYSD